MTMKRWNCSLSDIITKNIENIKNKKHSLTDEQKVVIFYNILKGLCHIQSYYIIHADLRSANILVNKNYDMIAIADFGLTSIDDCAKVRQTAKPFKPIKCFIN